MYQPESTQRVRPRGRPCVKTHDTRADDHDIFGTEGGDLSTPCRGRKVVDLPIAPPQDDSVVRVGRRHISPRHNANIACEKSFSGDSYNPANADRYMHSRRHETNGNILCGGDAPDAFELKKPLREVTGRTNTSMDLLAHTNEDPSMFMKIRGSVRRAENCPFAREDGISAPEASIKPLHPGNVHHGDVLTGGKMEARYAGRHAVF